MSFRIKWAYVVIGTGVMLSVAEFSGIFSRQAATANAASTQSAETLAKVVDVAEVVYKPISEFQTYSGRLQAIDRVEVRPLVSGTIVAVHFRDGALVKKGDALFTIDPRPYVAAADEAAGRVAAAEARNSYATTEAARAERLLSDNAIARRDYDEKQNAAREALANVRAMRAALEAARVNLGDTAISAPVTGRVSRAELTVGNVVSTGSSAPVLTTVVSVSPIYAAFDVDEQTYLAYLAHDAKGAVSVSLGLANEPGYGRTGVIDSVDNELDPRSGTIRVRARFDNADRTLVPGLYARVKVGGGTLHSAVMIDDSAVGTDQDKKYVLVLDQNNRVSYRQVALGSEHDGLRVITQGLRRGERIVVNGLQRVRPDDVVTPKTVVMGRTSTTRS
jgi:multidrug efflux system membrane fusion protein